MEISITLLKIYWNSCFSKIVCMQLCFSITQEIFQDFYCMRPSLMIPHYDLLKMLGLDNYFSTVFLVQFKKHAKKDSESSNLCWISRNFVFKTQRYVEGRVYSNHLWRTTKFTFFKKELTFSITFNIIIQFPFFINHYSSIDRRE